MNKIEKLEKQAKEILEEIEKLKKEEKEESKKVSKVWKPEFDEFYYMVEADGEVLENVWFDEDDGEKNYNMGNCFKTREEAEKVVEKLKIYTQLKRLAEEINTEPIDWENENQSKYHIVYNHGTNYLLKLYITNMQSLGEIYCTNSNFLDIALERIGEEKLLKLFKE